MTAVEAYRQAVARSNALIKRLNDVRDACPNNAEYIEDELDEALRIEDDLRLLAYDKVNNSDVH